LKKLTTGVLAGAATAALVAALVQQPATAAITGDAPSQKDNPSASSSHRPDNRPGPLTKQQQKLREAALEKLRHGTATKQAQAKGGSTVKVASGKSVEFFDNNKQAKILTILSEFGDQVDRAYGGTAGPLHNQIPEPVRQQDNSTTWTKDFDQAHYDAMFNGPGESFKSFYRDLSGGRYTADGTVEGAPRADGTADWVRVPYNAAYYGANPREDNGGAWDFINDTGAAWYAAQIAAHKSPADIDRYLSQFDQWDRYDYDGDGNFNEPDGYIDHFQAIHAGEGEEAGASPDAIWSHRWYAFGNQFGETGPTLADGTQNLYGGTRIGSSSFFIGDYTVEPENGGLGVFAHEYGHDLGLPDFYDTAGGDNGTSFWTLMSSGSWLSHGGTDGIGTTPGLMGPDERMFLGWLDYTTVDPGHKGSYTLNPAGSPTVATNTTQAVLVNLPDKTTTTQYVTPKTGAHEWWSGRGDDLSNTITRSVAAGLVTVSASAWYSIEQDYDYLYAEYSTDNGGTWTKLADANGATDPTKTGITGSSGGAWKTLSYTYDTAGVPSLFRFRYQTDGGVNEEGAFLDDIAVTAGGTTLTDGAENGTGGWTAKGWKITTGTESVTTPQYYLLENRAYVGYDKTLQQGPYNFSEAVTRPNWVEFFPYQDGMLVWYADKAYADNNTTAHPGHGQALPVDARPAPFYYGDGTKPGNRRQPFDATFGLQKTDAVCLHKQVARGNSANAKYDTYEACAPSSAGIRTFDDSRQDAYWSSANPLSSTKVAGAGVKATVTGQSGDFLTVSVTNPAG
jgi:immune inhibitor A